MIKFKIFEYQEGRYGYTLSEFVKEVQKFLDTHKIVNIERTQSSDSVSGGFGGGGAIISYIGYVIKYEK